MALDFPSSPTNGQTFISGTRTWTYNTTTSSWEASSIATSKTANYVYAAPNGSAGIPDFRALVAADIPTLNQDTTGTASNITNNSTYMLSRGSVLAANVDTATLNGFYSQTNASDSQGLLVFNSGGSLGPLQMTFTYGGLMQFRNKTDSTNWTTWKTVVTGVSGTAPIVSSGGATPAISISAATTSAAGSMSAADKTKLDGIATSANNYSLPKATATSLGGVELFDATVQATAANAVTSTASRTYGVQLNSADQMVVNVPWVDTTNTGTVTSVGGTGTVSGLTLSGTVTSSGNLTLGGALSLTSSNVTTALGFTPYNATNPSNYITASALTPYALLSGATFTGSVSFPGGSNIATNGDIYARRSSGTTGVYYFADGGSKYLFWDGGQYVFGNAGPATITTSFRAPLFYDSNDTTYYTGPATNSILNTTFVNRYFQRSSGVPTNNLGDPTVTEMALFEEQFNNKTAFFPPANVICETSTDGTNWTLFAVSDTVKKNLVGGTSGTGLGIPYGTAYFRVRFVNDGNYVYLNALYSSWSGNGHNTKVQIHKKDFGSTTWVQHTNSNVLVSSWPGHLYLPFSTIAYHPGTYVDQVAVVFQPTWNASFPSNSISLQKMQIWGGYPQGRRTGYSIDADKNYTFPSDVRATLLYDSQNTSYYVDPASTSAFNYVGVAQGQGINFNGSGSTIIKGTSTDNAVAGGSNLQIQSWFGIGFGPSISGQLVPINENAVWINARDGDLTARRILVAQQDARAPIFYDTNDTTYYVDPNSTSVMNAIQPWGEVGMRRGDSGTLLRSYNTSASQSTQFYVNHNLAAVEIGNARGIVYAGGSYWQIANSARAPIFYDSDNTGYYVDAAGTSNLSGITMNGTLTGVTGRFQKNQTAGDYTTAALWTESYGSTATGIAFHISGNVGKFLEMRTDQILYWPGTINASGDFRAPIFYDNNNTAYYIDAASTSNLNGLTVAGVISGNISGYSTYLPTRYDGGQITNPQTYFGQSIGLRVAMTGMPNVWSDTLWINGYSGGDVLSMCALHTSRAGTPRMWITTQQSTATSYGTFYEFPTLGYNSGNTNGLYAGIYYDSANTGFYVDPNGGFYLAGAGSTVYSSTSSGLYVSNAEGVTATVRVGAAYGRTGVYSNTSMHVQSESTIEFWTTNGQRGYFDNSSNLFANASMRAPIFYDSNDTAYWVNPNNSQSIRTAGDWRSDSGAWTGEFSGKIQYHANNWYFQGASEWIFRKSDSNTAFNVTQAGIAIAAQDMRAPIFYDNNNTAYYVDSAATSYINALNIGPTAGGASYLNINGYNAYGGTGYHGFLTIRNTYGSATNPQQYWRLNAAGGFEIVNNAYNAVLFTLTQGGDFTAAGNVTAYSDRKLKANFEPIENAVSKVLQLNGVTFTRIDKEDATIRYAGLIAQDVEVALPEAVQSNETMSYGEVKSVDYNGTIALLVEAIKELKAEIETLKSTAQK